MANEKYNCNYYSRAMKVVNHCLDNTEVNHFVVLLLLVKNIYNPYLLIRQVGEKTKKRHHDREDEASFWRRYMPEVFYYYMTCGLNLKRIG